MKCFLFAQQKLGLFKVLQVEYGREHFSGLVAFRIGMPKCSNKCIDNIRPVVPGMGQKKPTWLGGLDVRLI